MGSSIPRKTRYRTVGEEEVETEPEVKVKKIRKVGKMSKKNKSAFIIKIFNNQNEVHPYVQF